MRNETSEEMLEWLEGHEAVSLIASETGRHGSRNRTLKVRTIISTTPKVDFEVRIGDVITLHTTLNDALAEYCDEK